MAAAWGAVAISSFPPAAPVALPVAGVIMLGTTAFAVAKHPIGTVQSLAAVPVLLAGMFPITGRSYTWGSINRGSEVPQARSRNIAIWGDMPTMQLNVGITTPITKSSGFIPFGPKIFTITDTRYQQYNNAIVGPDTAAGKQMGVTVAESFNYSSFNRYVPEMPYPRNHSSLPEQALGVTSFYNSVYFREEISKDTQQKFISLLKTIERQGSLTVENQISIDEYRVSRSSNSGLYDYMVRGKTETFNLNWAKYCLTHGHWKRINNKRLNRGVYGYLELTPEKQNYFVLGNGSEESYFDVKPWPKDYPTLDGKTASSWALGMRQITYLEWADILKNKEKSEYWGLSFILVPVKLTYLTLEPADIIIDLRGNWGGVTTNAAIINQLSKNPLKPIVVGTEKTVPSPSTTLLPSLPPVPITTPNQGSSTTSTTSTTIPKATTTTSTVPKSTTTSTLPKSTTSTVPAKVIPFRPADRYDPPITTITPPNVTTITNKIPIIIGDSIALGLSDRYDFLNPGVETSQVLPNVFHNDPSACQNETYFPKSSGLYSLFCAWDGYCYRVGDNMDAVGRRINNVLKYIDQKEKQLNSRILWLSTGASNQIKQASDVAGALVKVKTQFDQIKVYKDRKKIALVYVMGVSKQLNDKYPGTNFNFNLEAQCKKYGYIFVGDFDASNDPAKIHPPTYIDIVDGLIDSIPTAPINVPPGSSTTSTTIQIGTTTTLLPSSPTTVTTYIPAAPGARPGAGAAGIGAPRPPQRPTTSTTTTPQSTTTVTTNPNGSIVTTTTVFPPFRPADRYDPSTSTTVAPDGISTTTTILSNGATTTTIVTPSTTTPPANGSPSSTVVTTVPVTTGPVPKVTIPDQRDGVAPPSTIIPVGPTVPEPKFLSYSVTSMTPENDDQEGTQRSVNIDVKLTLNFDLSMVRNSGSIFFYKKNTTKALAKIDIFSSEVSFLDYNSINIIPKNVLPYNTKISVFIGAHVLKSSAGKSWAGNAGQWDSITFTTIPDPNTPAPPVVTEPSPGPKPKPTKPQPVNPNPAPGDAPSKPAPAIPGNPELTPPNETVQPPTDSVIVINDPVKNETTLQSNDGLWTRNGDFVETKFKSLKQDLIISQIASHTSWVLEFNISDDAGVVKNIGRIGLETDVPKCVGDIESPTVCFFSMYGGLKTIAELAVDRYRQAPCENRVTDHGPGLSLRNKLIWRNGDSFEFRVSLSESQTQQYNVTYKCLSTARPVAPGFSETIYETDTDKIYMWNGLEWFQIASATLNIAQAAIFDNPNTFIINGNWWYGMVWNKTLRRTYPLGKIFVPSDYLNIDATKNYVRYSGPESEKTNVKERKASAKFITPIGFSLDGARGVYKSQ